MKCTTKPASGKSTDLARPSPKSRISPTFNPEETFGYDDYWQSNSDFLYSCKLVYFKYLRDMDEGRRNGPAWYNSEYFTAVDNEILVNIITDHLGLTVPQRKRVEAFIRRENLQKWGVWKELVIVSACLYVVHSDEGDRRECHPNCSEKTADEILDKALYEYNFTLEQLRSKYGKVDYKMRMWESKRGI